MTEMIGFQCLNCGHRFEPEVLTHEEMYQADQRAMSVTSGQCT